MKTIDPDGADNLVLRTRNVGVHKKGSGASCDTEALLVDKDTGEVYYRMLSASFLVGETPLQRQHRTSVRIGTDGGRGRGRAEAPISVLSFDGGGSLLLTYLVY